MASVLTPTKPEVPSRTGHSGSNGNSGFGGWGSGGNGGEGAWEHPGRVVPARAYRTGMWMALVAIVMLFAAFTSAMIVRRGMNNDWVATAPPRILYLNTVILLISSLTLEVSRRSLAAGSSFSPEHLLRWLYATLGLGLAFIGGQWMAWRELASRGVYLASNPSSSFFYLLTAAHGLHLLGGIVALFYLVLRARTLAITPSRRTALDVTGIYWHFMDGLWIYILLLLTVRS